MTRGYQTIELTGKAKLLGEKYKLDNIILVDLGSEKTELAYISKVLTPLFNRINVSILASALEQAVEKNQLIELKIGDVDKVGSETYNAIAGGVSAAVSEVLFTDISGGISEMRAFIKHVGGLLVKASREDMEINKKIDAQNEFLSLECALEGQRLFLMEYYINLIRKNFFFLEKEFTIYCKQFDNVSYSSVVEFVALNKGKIKINQTQQYKN